ncbi:CSC1-like protein 2 [Paralichthys olivaceus]|uniref:CSC1-like protein 2 n=1 Tax=Paralichthys olivaceus TaxID=8255 RepID=UPI003752F511
MVENVKAHFTEAYPTCEVTAVTKGNDMTKLMSLDQDSIEAGENLHYYKSVLEKTETSQEINPHVSGQLWRCCSSEEVDAIDFYTNKEQYLLQKMREQLEKGEPCPPGGGLCHL